jgi:hypothetical protein
METTMEISQHTPETRNRPRPHGHYLPQVSAFDACHDHAEAIVAHFFDRRDWEPLGPDVLHDASFPCHGASLPGAPKHQTAVVLKDVCVSTGG